VVPALFSGKSDRRRAGHDARPALHSSTTSRRPAAWSLATRSSPFGPARRITSDSIAEIRGTKSINPALVHHHAVTIGGGPAASPLPFTPIDVVGQPELFREESPGNDRYDKAKSRQPNFGPAGPLPLAAIGLYEMFPAGHQAQCHPVTITAAGGFASGAGSG